MHPLYMYIHHIYTPLNSLYTPLHGRYCGFIRIEESEDNELRYCLENKEMSITLALGHYGTNLKYISGAHPPKCPVEMRPSTPTSSPIFFDIVEERWRPAAEWAQCTLGRAYNHFGVE